MNRKYAFFAVEGDSDQIIVRQVLRNFLGMALWNGKVNTLDDIWIRRSDVVPAYSPTTSGDVYRRSNIPSLLYNDSISVLLHQGEGSNLIKHVKAIFDTTELHNELAAFAVFVDADNEDLRAKTKQYRDRFADYFPGFPENPGTINKGNSGPSVGIFVFPNNLDAGVVEDLILQCGKIVYPSFVANASDYVDHFEDNLKGPIRWAPFDKQKAIIASVASLLKPGKSNLATLKDDSWISESARDSPMLKLLIDFCQNLLNIETKQDIAD